MSEARPLGRLIGQAVGKQAIQDGQAQVADEDSLEPRTRCEYLGARLRAIRTQISSVRQTA